MDFTSWIKRKRAVASEVIGDGCRRFLREWVINRPNRRRLHNTDFTVIANDCTGAVLCHDLGVRFNSPFVNLWLYPDDFLKYCEDMDRYNEAELVFDITQEEISYPIGRLDDIHIYFMHYHSAEEAAAKWNERKRRIRKENMYFIMDDRNGCTAEHMRRFQALPYENKLLFTNQKIDLPCAFFVKGFEKEDCVGIMSDFMGWLSCKKYYDQFDYITWLNGE